MALTAATRRYDFGFALLGPAVVSRLLRLLTQDFDAVRRAAFALLSRFPSGPLAGLGTAASVRALLGWAMPLVHSSREAESDAGAFILRCVAQRYVLQLGWRVRLAPGPAGVEIGIEPAAEAAALSAPEAHLAAAGGLVDGLLRLHDQTVATRPIDTRGGSDRSAVHGLLLCVRFVLEDLEASAPAVSAGEDACEARARWDSELRTWLPRVLSSAARASRMALAILCDPTPEGGVATLAASAAGSGAAASVVGVPHSASSVADVGFLGSSGSCDEAEAPGQYVREGKALVVISWLAIKEATVLLGQAVRLATPAATSGRAAPACRPAGGGGGKRGGAAASRLCLLQRSDVEVAAESLLHTLTTTRHDGAITAAASGLGMICERLLNLSASAGDCSLAYLPARWLEGLLSGTEVGGAGGAVTYLRRSAGLPHAVLAVLHAEQLGGSESAHRGGHVTSAGAMLASTVQRLLESAAPPGGETAGEKGGDKAGEKAADKPGGGVASDAGPEDGPWLVRVHSLNLLRLIFLDKAFQLAILPYVSDGFLAAFRALSAPQWAVRNSAVMLLAALLERATRQRRTREGKDEAHDGNGLGIRDFFAKAPALLPFLLEQLAACAAAATPDAPGHAPSPDPSRPDLYAILLLLSKLVASPVAEGTRARLETDGFIPLVRRCAASASARVRGIAARALVPLVEPGRLVSFVTSLAAELPASRTGLTSLTSRNQLHGLLLQLRALLGSAVQRTRGLGEASAARLETRALCDSALAALGPTLHLLGQRRYCPPLAAGLTHLLIALEPAASVEALRPAACAVRAVVGAALRGGEGEAACRGAEGEAACRLVGAAECEAEMCVLCLRLLERPSLNLP